MFEGNAGTKYNYNKPEWFSESKIINEFNASEILAAGE